MADKKAFVFDTNFIIQNKELDEALNKLNEQYTVYITQVSIDERIAQQCRDVQKKFDDIKQFEAKYSFYITIDYKKTFEEECEFYQKGMQAKYDDYFSDRIIPLRQDGETLRAVIDRANKRIPPFSSAKDASDKGFKDCLLWLSLLNFFKDFGEDTVIFMTDDKSAFGNYREILAEEFHEITGKTLEIHPNSYYNEILNQINPPDQQEKINTAFKIEEMPNLESFRAELEDAVSALCYIEYEDYFGNLQTERTFTTTVPFDKDYTKVFFEGLRSDISSHIFETSVPASKIIDFDGRVANGEVEISLKNLENALGIYQRVLSNYSQYTEQFFEAATKILNRNYISPEVFEEINDDDLPF